MARTLHSLSAIEVGVLKGVGVKMTEALEKVGIRSVFDLITYYPRRHLDRTNEATIDEVVPGVETLVLGRIVRVATRRLRGGRVIVNATLADDTGYLDLVFFNQPYRERQLRGADDVAVFAKAEQYRGRLQMTNPIVDMVGATTGRIVPIYPQSQVAGLLTRDIAKFVAEALDRAGEIFDPLPKWVLSEFSLISRDAAIKGIHQPATMTEAKVARKRLVFDELLRLQLLLVAEKVKREQTSKGISHDVSPFQIGHATLVSDFLEQIPFTLTSAQQKVISEIASDMSSPIPMHRLLQGDVGSGKTLVALVSMLMAVQSGYQAALLAPTTVLAEQHLLSIKAQLGDFRVEANNDQEGMLFPMAHRPLRVEALTGQTTVARRREVLKDLKQGAIDILIGTHALLVEGVEFRNLGALVVDEQHRFGVEQRSLLREREKTNSGVEPDLLVMTATPIPRSAAMTVFGDLDVSVLDELPPGRTPIDTILLDHRELEESGWAEITARISNSEQAYVVCPLVEESEKLNTASANLVYERLSQGPLRGLRLGLVHGQMNDKQKNQTMEGFRRGDIDVLVATTVIEVGVDVPNATMIVILDADRFGIAQLHQLRGRVGRGAKASRCILVSSVDPDSPSAERLKAVVESTDGFRLAEKDLELRGAGELMGTRQKGATDLKLASITRDKVLVFAARKAAVRIVDRDYPMGSYPYLVNELTALIGEEEAANLFRG